MNGDNSQHLEVLYKELHRLRIGLGGSLRLRDCTETKPWPNAGVYFFFERGEHRKRSEDPRVVRVGTHAVSKGSKATLWNRLRTHRGTGKGLGNHRASIFRLHVGAAIAQRDERFLIETWGHGQSADTSTRKQEEELERAVSQHIGAMEILWLSIDDPPGPASDRAYIERHIISLLTVNNGPTDHPSPAWLGHYSPRQQIRESGLWNLDFISHPYDPDALEILHEYVSATIGTSAKPTTSIAPSEWRQRA